MFALPETYTLLRIETKSDEEAFAELRKLREVRISPELAAAGLAPNGIWFEIRVNGESVFRLLVG